MQNDKQFNQLGYTFKKMRTLVDSQDKIGWRNFMEGYISSHFYNIQWFHLSMSSNYLNSADWTKQFTVSFGRGASKSTTQGGIFDLNMYVTFDCAGIAAF